VGPLALELPGEQVGIGHGHILASLVGSPH
jgi:hypothetical protein